MLDIQTLASNLFFGAIGLGSGGYLMWRRFRSDSNLDKIDAKQQQFHDNLIKQLHEEREHSSNCEAAIERLSHERNEAVINVGRLQGTVEILREKVALLTDEVSSLRAENRRMTEEMAANRANIEALVDVNHKILAVLATQHPTLSIAVSP